MGADAPANGKSVKQGNKQYLHGDPYGAAVTPDGRADCEAGQRGYLESNARFYDNQYKIDQDARHAGRPGPDLQGPRRACRRARRSRRSPRPARTRRCPRPRAVSDETPARTA